MDKTKEEKKISSGVVVVATMIIFIIIIAIVVRCRFVDSAVGLSNFRYKQQDK